MASKKKPQARKNVKVRYYKTEYGTLVCVPMSNWMPCTWQLLTKREYDREKKLNPRNVA